MVNDKGRAFIVRGLAQLGKRYIFGHEVKLNDPSPRAFDCSELIQWLAAWAGVTVPDGSGNQYAAATVSLASPAAPGDLGFCRGTWRRGISHVAVYLGDNRVLEARNRLAGVKVTTVREFEGRRGFAGWRRVPALFDALNDPAPKSKPKKGHYGVVKAGALNLRRGPATRYGVLRVMPHGAQVRILQRAKRGPWVKVEYHGTVGWCNANDGKYLEA